MFILKVLSYVLVLIIAIAAAIIKYSVFPMMMSRRDRWRMSDWDYMVNRIVESVVLFFVLLIFGVAMVHSIFCG
jgi:hypothetical protein